MRVVLALLLAAAAPTMTTTHETQDPGPEDQETPADRAGVLEAAREIMETAGYAALVTFGPAGHPQARAMDPFEPDDDLTVWMGTNRTTRKVEELRRDPRATLHYFDPEGLGYVTLLGEAEIVEDPAERRSRWKPEWADFYPGGPEGPTYLLLRFVPHRLEIVSPEHGIADEPLAWKPRIVELDGAREARR